MPLPRRIFRIDDLSGVDPKPPILWIRGADDVIVSDTSLCDMGFLGSLVLQSRLRDVSTVPVVALTGPVLVAAAPF